MREILNQSLERSRG